MRRRPPKLRDELVTLAHGAGGKATQALVEGLFVPAFANPVLEALGDAAVLDVGGRRLALTTDSYVVRPRWFPGGDIGSLAVHGTINDLAMAGADPLALSTGFVLEEGLPVEELRRVATSLGAAAAAAGVPVVAGDTKVVERGKADGLYVTAAGVGVVPADVELAADRVRPGDRILLSGTVGDHGLAVLVARGELALEAELASDTAPLHRLAAALRTLGGALRWLRDPTRGGLATTVNELAAAARLSVRLEEAAIPVRPEVAGACEILGLDPLTIANEGKLVAVLAADAADEALALLRSDPLGAAAAIVGTVERGDAGLVVMTTRLGGSRVVDMLVGDPLPRIC